MSCSVIRPNENDILLGRGSNKYTHSGNEQLRCIAQDRAGEYVVARKKHKAAISRQIIHQIQNMNPPGRFLLYNYSTNEWEIVSDAVAREKVCQTLRKKKPCSHNGCTNKFVQGGFCSRNGARAKHCNQEGCTKIVVNGGVCIKHGAKMNRCSHEECTLQDQRGGVCIRYGAYHSMTALDFSDDEEIGAWIWKSSRMGRLSRMDRTDKAVSDK
ncbi:hypothetical protein ACHAXA_009103 [Cyclostephanos tholiformis]|uniref:DUF6824 domain-containing protein n=1 Tax=Cyclostephanos tholiformis TaxID=382380 RepID=A0ABD3SQ52_9STRA